jgi:hypothetical protein
MNAYFKMTEAQERDLSRVSASLGVISEMLDTAHGKQITLDPVETAALLTLLRERLPSYKNMIYVVE